MPWHVLNFPSSFQDVIRSISIGHENRSIRANRDGARVKGNFIFENSGFGGRFDFPKLLAVHVEFDDLMVRRPRRVNVFLALLDSNFERVNACRPDRFQEFAFFVEHHNPAFRVGGDVNISRAIDDRSAVTRSKLFAARILFEEIRDQRVFQVLRKILGRGNGQSANQRQCKSFHG
jgi:hypothetical protein